MLKTRITELLGIRYPIIQGGMIMVSCPELAAAVSNAGGLGILTSANFSNAEELRVEIRKTWELTDQPFGVNISLFPALRPIPNEEFIDILIEEGVPVVETSGVKSPEEYVGRLHAGGVKIIHKCAGVRYARKAEKIGADAVTVVGVENGGATGMLDITTLVLVPITVDALQVPVIAGGGIADARGFVAALSLGAEGVVIGTRFMATKESPIHNNFKEWLLRATEVDTTLVLRSIRNTHRVLKNRASDKVQELEARGASLDELIPIIAGEQGDKVFKKGELEGGMAHCGQVVGLIREITSVRDVIDSIIEGAREIMKNLGEKIQ